MYYTKTAFPQVIHSFITGQLTIGWSLTISLFPYRTIISEITITKITSLTQKILTERNKQVHDATSEILVQATNAHTERSVVAQ